MAQATPECPQNPTRKLLILLQTNGDVQLDQMALEWLDPACDTAYDQGRPTASHAGGLGFESLRAHHSNQQVTGCQHDHLPAAQAISQSALIVSMLYKPRGSRIGLAVRPNPPKITVVGSQIAIGTSVPALDTSARFVCETLRLRY